MSEDAHKHSVDDAGGLAALALVKRVADDEGSAISAAIDLKRVKAGVTQALKQNQRRLSDRRPSGKRTWVLALAATLGIAAAIALVSRPADVRISEHGVISPGRVGSWQGSDAALTLAFGASGYVTVRGDDVLQVQTVSAQRIEVTFDERLALRVRDRQLTVHMGAFTIQTSGAEAWLSWDQANKSLSVKTSEGLLEITGPTQADGTQGTITVRGRQDLQIPAYPRPNIQAPSEPITDIAPIVREPQRRSDVLEQPTQTEPTCSTLNYAELTAHGSETQIQFAIDCARRDMRREALLPLYEAAAERFPSSPLGRQALFEAGRLSVRTAPARARELFSRYLAADPHAQFAQEASGRLLQLSTGREQQGLATRYLEQWPTGPYAAEARARLGERGP